MQSDSEPKLRSDGVGPVDFELCSKSKYWCVLQVYIRQEKRIFLDDIDYILAQLSLTPSYDQTRVQRCVGEMLFFSFKQILFALNQHDAFTI